MFTAVPPWITVACTVEWGGSKRGSAIGAQPVPHIVQQRHEFARHHHGIGAFFRARWNGFPAVAAW